MALAFLASGALGMLVEWALIRHLYRRQLDTLLATWGLSLILQQVYRSVFGAREVGVDMPIVRQVKMVLDGTMNPRDIAPHLTTDDDQPLSRDARRATLRGSGGPHELDHPPRPGQ